MQENGIEIFGRDGLKLDDTVGFEHDRLILEIQSLEQPQLTGRDISFAIRIDEVRGRFIVRLKSTCPSSLTPEGLKVVVDSALGAAHAVDPDAVGGAGVIGEKFCPKQPGAPPTGAVLARQVQQLAVSASGRSSTPSAPTREDVSSPQDIEATARTMFRRVPEEQPSRRPGTAPEVIRGWAVCTRKRRRTVEVRLAKPSGPLV